MLKKIAALLLVPVLLAGCSAAGDVETLLRAPQLSGESAAPQKALNNIYASVKNIQRNPTMTADEKRQLMDAMTFQAVEIARQGNEDFDAVETTLKGLAERK